MRGAHLHAGSASPQHNKSKTPSSALHSCLRGSPAARQRPAWHAACACGKLRGCRRSTFPSPPQRAGCLQQERLCSTLVRSQNLAACPHLRLLLQTGGQLPGWASRLQAAWLDLPSMHCFSRADVTKLSGTECAVDLLQARHGAAVTFCHQACQQTGSLTARACTDAGACLLSIIQHTW